MSTSATNFVSTLGIYAGSIGTIGAVLVGGVRLFVVPPLRDQLEKSIDKVEDNTDRKIQAISDRLDRHVESHLKR